MRFHCAGLVIGLLAFVVNPGLGCSGDDGPGEGSQAGGFLFGREEMVAAVVGRWRFVGEGVSKEVVLRAAEAPRKALGPSFVRSAMACGGRTFYRSAAACVSLSRLHLDGEVIAAEGGAKSPIAGEFTIYGDRLSPGELRVTFPDGGVLKVGRLDAESSVFAGEWSNNNGPPVPVKLERLEQ